MGREQNGEEGVLSIAVSWYFTLGYQYIDVKLINQELEA